MAWNLNTASRSSRPDHDCEVFIVGEVIDCVLWIFVFRLSAHPFQLLSAFSLMAKKITITKQHKPAKEK